MTHNDSAIHEPVMSTLTVWKTLHGDVGTEDQRLLVARLQRDADTPAMMAFDKHLQLAFTSTTMATMLGYKPANMKGMELAAFMPQPFGYLHQRWIKEMDGDGKRAQGASCRGGGVQTLLTSTGSVVTARLCITSKEVKGTVM